MTTITATRNFLSESTYKIYHNYVMKPIQHVIDLVLDIQEEHENKR